MMKKITLLLFTMALMFQTGFGQLIVFEESFTTFAALADPPPPGWVALNEDTLTVDAFYTNQGAFIGNTWEHENFGAPYSSGIFSCSNVTTTGLPVSNWLISPQIALLANPVFEIEVVATFAGMVEVRYATALAGATPAASDFTNILDTFNTTGAYTLNTTDISALANMSVYFAFVDLNTDGDILGMRNFKILEPVADDIKLDAISFDERLQTADGLIIDYALFCNATTANVSLDITNVGVNPITTFNASYDNGSTEATETFTIPSLAGGQSTTVTFTVPANVDTFDGYFIDAYVNMTNDTINNNDTSTGNLTLMVTPDPDTIDLANPFFTSFEQFDGANIGNLANAWWTHEDTDGNGNEFRVIGGQTTQASSGSYSLELIGNAASANTDWAFSPCMYFDDTKAYVINFKSFVGSFTSGNPVPATLAMHLMSDDNSTSSVQSLGNITADDNVSFQDNSITFAPTTSGLYNIGINQASALDWHVWIDEFGVEELIAPTAPVVSNTWDACALTATISFNYSSVNTYTVDWGDGSAVETLTSGSATHTYVGGTMPTVTVTATNLVGNADGTTIVDAVANPAPDSDFTYVQSGTAALVTFNADQAISCYTSEWNFGDNSPLSSSNNAQHTYSTNGTFNVVHTVQKGTTEESVTIKAITVAGVAINEIDFVNGIEIFPNPTSNSLYINFELNTKQNVSISFVSLDGREVFTNTVNNAVINEEINVSDFASGIYVINITTNEGNFTKNIMVK